MQFLRRTILGPSSEKVIPAISGAITRQVLSGHSAAPQRYRHAVELERIGPCFGVRFVRGVAHEESRRAYPAKQRRFARTSLLVALEGLRSRSRLQKAPRSRAATFSWQERIDHFERPNSRPPGSDARPQTEPRHLEPKTLGHDPHARPKQKGPRCSGQWRDRLGPRLNQGSDDQTTGFPVVRSNFHQALQSACLVHTMLEDQQSTETWSAARVWRVLAAEIPGIW